MYMYIYIYTYTYIYIYIYTYVCAIWAHDRYSLLSCITTLYPHASAAISLTSLLCTLHSSPCLILSNLSSVTYTLNPTQHSLQSPILHPMVYDL